MIRADSWLTSGMGIKIITASPNGDSMDGIIKKIKDQNANPLDFIATSYNGPQTNGYSDYLVTSGDFQCYGGQIAWVQYRFLNYLYYPTYYTLKEVSVKWTYSRNWTVFGFNEYNKNDESKWDIIGNGSSCDDYCGYNEYGTYSGNYKTYQVNNNKRKGYNYIRWNVTKGSYKTYKTFSASAIELFGVLSYGTYKGNCATKNRSSFIPKALLIVNMILIS